MYKEIIKSETQEIMITLPKAYLNKELEITILPRKMKTDYSKYFGIIKKENIEDEIREIRNQWDRI